MMKRIITTLVILLGLSLPAYAQQEVDATALLFWAGGTPRCEGRVGSGAPSGGNTCDFYIDYSTGNLYTKISGTWTVVGNLTGTLTATRVPFASSAHVLTDDADMTFATDTLSITKVNSPFVRSNYTSGFTGSGYTVDYNTSVASQSFLEVDQLSVRGIFSVYELLVHQIRATNGSIFVSNTGKANAVAFNGLSSYTITTDTEHGFATGDLIRAQRFTGSGTYQVDMELTSVGSSLQFTANLISGTTPTDGMEFVRLGNTATTSRQNSIYMTADDTNNPYLRVQAAVSSFAEWNSSAKTRVAVGNLNGSYGYVADTFGFATGVDTATNITMDASNGLRFLNSTTVLGQLTSSAWTLGNTVSEHVAISSTAFQVKDGSDVYTDISAGAVTVGKVAAALGNVLLDATNCVSVRMNTTVRIRLACDGSGYLANSSIAWDTSGNLTVAGNATFGGFAVGSDYIRDAANSFGLASTVTGVNDVRFWAGDTFANRVTAPLHIYEDGQVVVGSTVAGNYISLNANGTVAAYDTSGTSGAKIDLTILDATPNGVPFISMGAGNTTSQFRASSTNGTIVFDITGGVSASDVAFTIQNSQINSKTTLALSRTVATASTWEMSLPTSSTSLSFASGGSDRLVLSNTGVITTGVWNAGAVTSSGTVAGVDGTFSGQGTFVGASSGANALYLNGRASDNIAYIQWRSNGGSATGYGYIGGNASALSIGHGTQISLEGPVTATSTIDATGYRSRAGTSGSYSANYMNTYWNGACTKLYVDTTDTGCITVSSDARLKKSMTFTTPWDVFMDLKPKRGTWKDGEQIGDTRLHYWLEAQDVEKTMPHLAWVMPTPESPFKSRTPDGIHRVDYDGFITVLIERVQQLRRDVVALEKRLEKIEVR